MSYFKVKMHHIRFWLGFQLSLRPRPRWKAYFYKGRERREGGRGERKEVKGRDGEGKVREERPVFSVQYVGNPIAY